jgi:hypothetical protein
MFNPNYCRHRAERCREIAGSIQDLERIQQLILLSVGFDVQAEVLDLHDAALNEALGEMDGEGLGTPSTH